MATLFPSTGKLYDNVVTAVPMVNTYFLPPSPLPLTNDWRPGGGYLERRGQRDLRRTLTIPHHCGEKGKWRLQDG